MDLSIEPFTIDVPQSELDDLRQRLAQTRWPGEVPDQGWERGIPVGYLRELAEYWRTGYDWRAAEAELNSHPQFLATVDGARIHLLHVRSGNPDAVPLLLTHGWPGSVVEFLDLIPLLRHDFHLVIPALPGFGFSGSLPDAGWNIPRIAAAWGELMTGLGYERFGAQGGDWGSDVTLELARQFPERIIGAHVNMLAGGVSRGDEPRDDDERERMGKLKIYMDRLSGYMQIQSRRPQTLAYGLTDSPVGQLAWIMDMFREWTDCRQLPEEAIGRDRMLTNVTIYWLTATAGSSAQIYYEEASSWGAGDPVTAPVAVAVFPRDISKPVRRLAEPRVGNVVRWNEFEHGGHFAALEQPRLLADDVRRFFLDDLRRT